MELFNKFTSTESDVETILFFVI